MGESRLSAILWAASAFVLVVGAVIQIYRIREPIESVHGWADLLPLVAMLSAAFLCSVSAIFAVRRALRDPNAAEHKGTE